MKRIWASVIILIILVVACSIGLSTTQRISADLTQTVTNAKSAAENSDRRSAYELSSRAVSDWKQSHEILCTYMPHSKLEAIDQTLSALPALAQHESYDQFVSECDRAVTQIHYLNESETPSLQNIL